MNINTKVTAHVNKNGEYFTVEKFKKHWKPDNQQKYYYIDIFGEISSGIYTSSCRDAYLIKNYNALPTWQVAKKLLNLSKLDRLILLWQCNNDCIFLFNKSNDNQKKYYVSCSDENCDILYDFSIATKRDTIYFKTKEQVEAFIGMYRTEIKELMNIK